MTATKTRPAPTPPPVSKKRVWAPIIGLVVVAVGLFFLLTSVFGGHSSSPVSKGATTSVAPKANSLSDAIQAHGQAVQQGVNNGTQQQASGVTLTPATGKPGAASVAVGAQTGGCTQGYGQGKQCLAITPPSAGQMNMSVQEMPWTCTEVKTIFPNGLPLNVKGVDPAHLDGNKDGIACDNGDNS